VARAEKRQRKKDNARAAREAREAALKRQKQRRTAIRFGVIALPFLVLFIILATRGGNDNDKKSATTSTTSTTAAPATTTTTTKVKPLFTKPSPALDPAKTYTATITTNFGDIVVDLDVKNAPKASARFVEIARAGKYDHLKWVRSSKDFVIQGGSPDNTQSGTFGSSVVGEVPTDNYPVGSLAAAKTAADPAGTYDAQFFIVTGSGGATLPNDYARFGMVTQGIENAQKIEALAPESGDGPPTKDATIDKIVITEK
jgi:cyclophilin family peptidyl-prolyl cis-trans isomerase